VVMPDSPAFPTGPAVGDPFPEIALPDQHGVTLGLAAARAGRRLMLVVFRSVVW
jgi:peroxiredoxin